MKSHLASDAFPPSISRDSHLASDAIADQHLTRLATQHVTRYETREMRSEGVLSSGSTALASFVCSQFFIGRHHSQCRASAGTGCWLADCLPTQKIEAVHGDRP
jgi:hypothetical protein